MCGKIVARQRRGSRGSGKWARGMKNLTDLSADYMSGQIDRADMERGNGRPEVRKSLFRRLYRIIYGRCRGESNDIMTVFYPTCIGVYSYTYIRCVGVWVCVRLFNVRTLRHRPSVHDPSSSPATTATYYSCRPNVS